MANQTSTLSDPAPVGIVGAYRRHVTKLLDSIENGRVRAPRRAAATA